MASSYTTGHGIELIGVGEQSGTWGTTTNNNLEIISKNLSGVETIAVTGATSPFQAIAMTNGDKTSNGHARVLKLTAGGVSGAAKLQVTPDDRQAFYFIDNQCGQDVSIIQRTSGGNEVVIPNGAKGLVYADGGGTNNANVVDLLDGIAFGNAKLNSTVAELNASTDGSTTVGTDAIADDDGIVTNDAGTMKQTKVQTFSTYFNQNLVEVKSVATISGALDVIAGAATSVYQQVIVYSGTQTINVQTDNLVAGQYVMIDKKTSANKITINWNAGDGTTALSGADVSTGLSLGDSVDFAIGVFNGTNFSFSETVKF